MDDNGEGRVSLLPALKSEAPPESSTAIQSIAKVLRVKYLS